MIPQTRSLPLSLSVSLTVSTAIAMFTFVTPTALSFPIPLCRSSNFSNQRGFRSGGFRVFNEGRKTPWTAMFDNPRAKPPQFKVVQVLFKSIATLTQPHNQVHISGTSVATKILQDKNVKETNLSRRRRKRVNVSGPVQPYTAPFKNFCYPVAFSAHFKVHTMVPIDCFEEPWVLFRGKDGKLGCLQNTCAHRACPLHLGSVNEGRIQCPYHGWEYSTDGKCEKMPSTKLRNVTIKSLPCFEHEGMVWIWPGDDPPAPNIPSLLPPSGFLIHAEIVTELPVEHGLLLDNLLDIVHAPFIHTSTFAKGWTLPNVVKFLTPANGLQGYWSPYPIDMEFLPPCMVLSTTGISKPGKLLGQTTKDYATHLHQLHVCLPSSRLKTRLLYRMSLDFAPLLKHIPFMKYLWQHFSHKVLKEDIRIILGQQERMLDGANVWNAPVSYDKLGIRYRLWRDSVEQGSKLPFTI